MLRATSCYLPMIEKEHPTWSSRGEPQTRTPLVLPFCPKLFPGLRAASSVPKRLTGCANPTPQLFEAWVFGEFEIGVGAPVNMKMETEYPFPMTGRLRHSGLPFSFCRVRWTRETPRWFPEGFPETGRPLP